MKALPNFRIGDRIQQYLSFDDNCALEDIMDYYRLHPRKFRATLAWAVGRDSDDFKRIMAIVKTQQVVIY